MLALKLAPVTGQQFHAVRKPGRLVFGTKSKLWADQTQQSGLAAAQHATCSISLWQSALAQDLAILRSINQAAAASGHTSCCADPAEGHRPVLG